MSRREARHRFYASELGQVGQSVLFAPNQSHQIARVLRMHAGERVVLFDGAGTECVAELTEVGDRRSRATIVARECRPWPSAWQPLLYVPLIRPQRFEWALEKAVELGAYAITPILTGRSVHGSETLSASRSERLRQIAIEAAEQCGSLYLPSVASPLSLPAALVEPAELRLFACEDAAAVRETVSQALSSAPAQQAPTRIALFVGPEGGFTRDEIACAVDAGCRLVTLGPHILRSETACVALLAQLLEHGMIHGDAADRDTVRRGGE